MNTSERSQPILLVADDDADDRYLLKSAFEESEINGKILFVEDGLDLLNFLNQNGNAEAKTLPGVILLDLNMPRKDGQTVLAELKEQERFQHIPIVVFSTSKSPDEIKKLYRMGANSFIVKPSSFDELVDVMKSLGNYWLNTVVLPNGSLQI